MGKYERERGARFEREVAKMLREHGYEAERGCQHAGGKDSPDVKHDMGGYHLECKYSEHFAVWSAMAQSERDAGDDEVPMVVFKRNRSKVYAVLEFETLIEIIKKSQGKEQREQTLLESAKAIRDFLADKSYTSAGYWDADGNEIMHTDIGYFDEGLEELIEYLQGKEQNK